MDGIFGATAHDDVVPVVMDGLRRLTRPGCISSGVAALTYRGVQRRRSGGPLWSLDPLLAEAPIAAPTVIGHTGHATLGVASRRNAQPHASSRVAVVHVGFIENHAAIRVELERKAVQFRSDTESEVIVWLLDRELANRAHPMAALQRTLRRLWGSFSLALICPQHPNTLYAAQRGRGLAVGKSASEAYLASDAEAFDDVAHEWIALEDGDMAELRPGHVRVFDHELARRDPRWHRSRRTSTAFVKRAAPTAAPTRAELRAQPVQVARVLRLLERDVASGAIEPWCGPLWKADRIVAIGSGDSYRAAQFARHWLEHVAAIPVELELSSELVARNAIFADGIVPLVVADSQSDPDALAALRDLKRRAIPSVALANGSSTEVAAQADFVLGARIGAAPSDRAAAFIVQLCMLAAATIAARRLREGLGADDRPLRSLLDVPAAMETALALDEPCAELGRRIAVAGRGVFVGRGLGRSLAEMGARHLESVSGLRSEGVAGGELSHRPNWRLEKGTPVVVVATRDCPAGQAVSDVRAVIACGGDPWVVADARTAALVARQGYACIVVDPIDPLWAPFVHFIPLQLIAAHAGRGRGLRAGTRLSTGKPAHQARTGRTAQ